MARDGEVVRTPMLIMDAAGVDLHRPGFCCATDATARDAVRDARREMIDRATTAWRNDARRKPPDDDDDDEDDERERHSDDARGNADARASYDAKCARLRDAWRRPVDVAQPDLGTRPEELMRRHARTEPDDDAQARRDRAYQDYTTTLAEAWRNPPGVSPAERAIVGGGPRSMVVERTTPDAATRIEQQREQWRGGR